MTEEVGYGSNPQVQDGDMICVEDSASGWVNGFEGVVAGTWEGRLRIRLVKETLPGVRAVLLDEDVR